MSKKLFPIILGCQMNLSDFEWLSGMLADEYDITANQNEADLIIITSCSVREKAANRLFATLNRLAVLKANNSQLIVAVTGCLAQELGHNFFKESSVADIVVGTKALPAFKEILAEFIKTERRQVNIDNEGDYDQLNVRRGSGVTAYVAIMRGCDNSCSYCIVPSLRGSEESRDINTILSDIKLLEQNNTKEVWLLGQNVNSYGRGSKNGADFPNLLKRIATETTIPWIRFITSHPKDLSDELIDVMATYPSICPSIHLPLQSGSNRILKRMKRGYTIEQYSQKIAKLRNAIPDITITSDFIVGFPGETSSDHKSTLDAIVQLSFHSIYLFIYSKRSNTLAASYTDSVPAELSKERFQEIWNLQKEQYGHRLDNFIGRNEVVLIEGASKKGGNSYNMRLANNIKGIVQLESDFTDQFISVTIKGKEKGRLIGKLIVQDSPYLSNLV
ncbi:MAG: tRNA (N6-isopentenyl adenosine(37)-C2)-methylthiotransferase MiaB [Nitrospinota bacterium]